LPSVVKVPPSVHNPTVQVQQGKKTNPSQRFPRFYHPYQYDCSKSRNQIVRQSLPQPHRYGAYIPLKCQPILDRYHECMDSQADHS